MSVLAKNNFGRICSFRSQRAWDQAIAWIMSTPSKSIFDFCALNGLDLMEDNGTPLADWKHEAMEFYAFLLPD
jgi:hypothetical protein